MPVWIYYSAMDAKADEVTQLLRRLESGHQEAGPKLLEVLYEELRRIAAIKLRNERPGHTLTPTALVHEAYLRLSHEQENIQQRSHFLCLAARAMRRVLVDHARTKRAAKRGAAPERLDLDRVEATVPGIRQDMLELDQALERLNQLSPRQSQVVELRYFAGLSEEEVAVVLGVDRRTVCRAWSMAKAFLYNALKS